MPRSGWFAVGAVAAAILAPLATVGPLGLLVLGAAAMLLAAALASIVPDHALGAIRRAGLGASIGAAAVATRLAIGGVLTPPPPTLPEGDGPWTARVAAIGAPRDGQQVATVQLVADPRVTLAATIARYPEVHPGETVEIDGRVEPPPEGSYGDWLRRTGVLGTVTSRTVRVVAEDMGPGGRLAALRASADQALRLALPEPGAGLASGILIGLRERVDRDLAAAFTTAGVSHVVAISGWNIAIVGATVAAILRGRRRRTRAVVTLMAIVAYTAFAGASASVVRAAAMAGVALLARESGRAGRAAGALGIACGLLLVADPGLVRDAGFQLSALATAGLLVWATPIRSTMDASRLGRLPGWVLEALALSTAAQLATLPVILATFGRLSVISPVANLLVAPLVPIAMATGAVALVGGSVAVIGAPGIVATMVGIPAWLALGALIRIVHASAAAPLASVDIGPPFDLVSGALATVAAIAALPGVRGRIAALVRRERPRAARSDRGSAGTEIGRARPERPVATHGRRVERILAIVLGGAVVVVAAAAIHRPDGHVRVTVLDVGQGDAILVEGENGGRLLVDGGPDPDRLIVALDGAVPPWDRRIDVLVLSHPHEDHVAGLPALLERYRVGRIVEPGMRGPGPGYRAWTDWLAAHRMHTERLATGDRLALDGIAFRVLWPDPGRVPLEPPDTGRAINDVSIVLAGSVGTGRFLLMGDVEDDVDPILVARGLPRTDVLKIAHHGSRTATTDAFLRAVRPAIAIASAGAGNPYGHPAPSTLRRVAALGARVLRTDEDGTVTATFDGRGWSVSAEHPRTAVAPAATPTLSVLSAAAFSCRIVPTIPGRASPTAAATPAAVPASASGYHRHDARPDPSPDQLDAPFPRPAGLAPPSFAGGGRGRCLARRGAPRHAGSRSTGRSSRARRSSTTSTSSCPRRTRPPDCRTVMLVRPGWRDRVGRSSRRRSPATRSRSSRIRCGASDSSVTRASRPGSSPTPTNVPVSAASRWTPGSPRGLAATRSAGRGRRRATPEPGPTGSRRTSASASRSPRPTSAARAGPTAGSRHRRDRSTRAPSSAFSGATTATASSSGRSPRRDGSPPSPASRPSATGRPGPRRTRIVSRSGSRPRRCSVAGRSSSSPSPRRWSARRPSERRSPRSSGGSPRATA